MQIEVEQTKIEYIITENGKRYIRTTIDNGSAVWNEIIDAHSNHDRWISMYSTEYKQLEDEFQKIMNERK